MDKRIWIGIFGVFVSSAVACVWDNDTLSIEARGMPEVLSVVVGRVTMNPPKFYERRIEIGLKALESHPDELLNYDNVAMAYDKLGRQDLARDILERKRMNLVARKIKPGKDPIFDPWYRYHANLGTVWAHEYARMGSSGQAPDSTPQLKRLLRAIEELERALEINPQAHFGREQVQVDLLRFLVQHPKAFSPTGMENEATNDWEAIAGRGGSTEFAKALASMMTFGGSHENPMMLALMFKSISYEDGYVRACVYLRYTELKYGKLPASLPPEIMIEDSFKLKRQFSALRSEAEVFAQTYTDFVNRQLDRGLHPDLDEKAFWSGYTPAPSPESEKIGMKFLNQHERMIQEGNLRRSKRETEMRQRQSGNATMKSSPQPMFPGFWFGAGALSAATAMFAYVRLRK